MCYRISVSLLCKNTLGYYQSGYWIVLFGKFDLFNLSHYTVFVDLQTAFSEGNNHHFFVLVQIWNGNSSMWDLLRMRLMTNY